MSPRIRSLICLTSSGVPVGTAFTPSKRVARTSATTRSAAHSLLVDREVAAEPDHHQRVVAVGEDAPQRRAHLAVGVVDQEVDERRVVERVRARGGEPDRILGGASAEVGRQLVARGLGGRLLRLGGLAPGGGDGGRGGGFPFLVPPHRSERERGCDRELVGREAERGERARAPRGTRRFGRASLERARRFAFGPTTSCPTSPVKTMIIGSPPNWCW